MKKQLSSTVAVVVIIAVVVVILIVGIFSVRGRKKPATGGIPTTMEAMKGMKAFGKTQSPQAAQGIKSPQPMMGGQ